MNCNYDCDESPSLSSNDCLMKNVTVLICSGVDGLSIFVSFSSWFNWRKFAYIFWKYWHKMFRLLVFLLHSKKNWNSSSRHCKSHIVFGPLVFWDIIINKCLKNEWQMIIEQLKVINIYTMQFNKIVHIEYQQWT